ncbi:MAG: tripartite tricarboxylate transporter TctB family protein [Defluviitaleaceae bacterium]|nr:tripartite tricarboxylate transporter TctB family protein [Defluviitaleaceae bacterium]
MACIIAIVLWILIPQQIRQTTVSGQIIDSQTIPRAISYLIGGLGIVLIVKSLLLKQETVVELSIPKEIRSLIFFAMMIAYMMLIPLIGFLFSSLILAVSALAFQKVKKPHLYVIAIVIIFLAHTAFIRLLGVPLP